MAGFNDFVGAGRRAPSMSLNNATMMPTRAGTPQADPGQQLYAGASGGNPGLRNAADGSPWQGGQMGPSNGSVSMPNLGSPFGGQMRPGSMPGFKTGMMGHQFGGQMRVAQGPWVTAFQQLMSRFNPQATWGNRMQPGNAVMPNIKIGR